MKALYFDRDGFVLLQKRLDNDYYLRNNKDKLLAWIFNSEKIVKPQFISGDFRRLFQMETPATVCG